MGDYKIVPTVVRGETIYKEGDYVFVRKRKDRKETELAGQILKISSDGYLYLDADKGETRGSGGSLGGVVAVANILSMVKVKSPSEVERILDIVEEKEKVWTDTMKVLWTKQEYLGLTKEEYTEWVVNGRRGLKARLLETGHF